MQRFRIAVVRSHALWHIRNTIVSSRWANQLQVKRFCTFGARPTKEKKPSDTGHFVTFDLGPINHPKYGHANFLTGAIPLLLPKGEYHVPEILSDSTSLETMVTDLIPACAGVYASPERSRQLIQDAILGTACMNPSVFRLDEPQLKCQIFGWISGMPADDLVDSIDAVAGKGQDPTIFPRDFSSTFIDSLQFWRRNINRFNIIQNFPRFLLPERLGPVFRVGQLLLEQLDAIRPEMRDEVYQGPPCAAAMNGMYSKWLQDAMAKDGIGFARHANENQLRIHMSMMRPYADLVTLCHGVQLSDLLRQNFIYELVMQNFEEITVLHNAIFGLLKDVNQDSVLDSPILSAVVIKKSGSLQDSFDVVAQNLLDTYKDFVYLSDKLLELFSASEPQLERYIYLLKYVIDGSLKAYAVTSRYGLRNKIKF